MTKTLEELSRKKCVPCEGGTPKLSRSDAQAMLGLLPGWKLEGGEIARTWAMKDFVSAVALIDRIKDAAQEADHHPDLHLTGYRNLEIRLSTHSIGGLSENDFILAARIEKLPKDLKKG
jgi:4a-hydroxytetrahydrobiopterin dehydratase